MNIVLLNASLAYRPNIVLQTRIRFLSHSKDTFSRILQPIEPRYYPFQWKLSSIEQMTIGIIPNLIESNYHSESSGQYISTMHFSHWPSTASISHYWWMQYTAPPNVLYFQDDSNILHLMSCLLALCHSWPNCYHCNTHHHSHLTSCSEYYFPFHIPSICYWCSALLSSHVSVNQ